MIQAPEEMASHGEMDPALHQQDPTHQEAEVHVVDPVSSLYTCPHCGLDRPVMDFYSEPAQAYNPYCSLCMAGYAEAAVAMQHQQTSLPEDGAQGDTAVGSHAQQAAQEGYPHSGALGHEHLNVQQLLAAQVVDAGPNDATQNGAMLSHQQLLMAQVMPAGHAVAATTLGYAHAHAHDPHAVLGYGMADPHAAAAAGILSDPDAATTKLCSKCKLTKAATEFPWLKDRRRGRGAHCNECRSQVESRAAREGSIDDAAPESEPSLYLPTVMEKRCAQCSQIKPAAAFRRTRNKTDHLQNRCKDCERVLGRGAKRDPTAPRMVQITHKLCIRCSVEKPADDFFTSKTSLDGLLTYCKACQKALSQASRKKRTEARKQGVQPEPEATRSDVPATKQCKLCGEEKASDQYYKSSNNADGLYTYCKACSTQKNTVGRKLRRQKQREKAQSISSSGADGEALLESEDPAAARMSIETLLPIPSTAERMANVTATAMGIAIGPNMQYNVPPHGHHPHHHHQNVFPPAGDLISGAPAGDLSHHPRGGPSATAVGYGGVYHGSSSLHGSDAQQYGGEEYTQQYLQHFGFDPRVGTTGSAVPSTGGTADVGYHQEMMQQGYYGSTTDAHNLYGDYADGTTAAGGDPAVHSAMPDGVFSSAAAAAADGAIATEVQLVNGGEAPPPVLDPGLQEVPEAQQDKDLHGGVCDRVERPSDGGIMMVRQPGAEDGPPAKRHRS